MTVLVILAHPASDSLNHAIADRAVDTLRASGHDAVFHDLCAEGFDPVLPADEVPQDAALDPVVASHCRDLADAEGIVIVHPNWWGQPPAVLKGWVDRVVRPGVAYRFLEGDGGEGVPQGLLKAKTALLFHTANTAPAREQAIFGDPLDTLWRNCIFGLCGVRNVVRRTFAIVVTSSPEQRREWLDEVERTVSECFPNSRTRAREGTGE